MAERIGGINSIHDVDCRLEAMWPGSFTEHVRTRFGPEESKGPREGAGGSAVLRWMAIFKERSEAGVS